MCWITKCTFLKKHKNQCKVRSHWRTRGIWGLTTRLTNFQGTTAPTRRQLQSSSCLCLLSATAALHYTWRHMQLCLSLLQLLSGSYFGKVLCCNRHTLTLASKEIIEGVMFLILLLACVGTFLCLVRCHLVTWRLYNLMDLNKKGA